MAAHSFITTHSQGLLNLHNPDPKQICLKDIALGLSHVCRFSGQLPRHYSVAAHSLVLADMVEDLEEKLYFLLHDASEAYITDLPAPVKALCSDYEFIETGIQEAVFKGFSVPEVLVKYGTNQTLKKMDRLMGCVEQFTLCGVDCPAWAKDSVVEAMREGSLPSGSLDKVYNTIEYFAGLPMHEVRDIYLKEVEEVLDGYKQTR